MKRILTLLCLCLSLVTLSAQDHLQLTWQPFTGQFRHAFGISTFTRSSTPIILTELRWGDLVGYGEAALPQYLKETPESVEAFLNKALPIIQSYDTPLKIDEILAAIWAIDDADDNRAAIASIDIALHDLWGKAKGRPVWQLWGIDPNQAPLTSFTIGYDEDDAVVLQKVEEAAWAKVLKVKLGRGIKKDQHLISLIRSKTNVPIYVDANQGWQTKQEALTMLKWLEKKNVVLVEQPMAKELMAEHKWLKERTKLPIIADEACQSLEDIVKLKDAYDGINIKLMKCGGLAKARLMIDEARKYGLQVMMGCMASETSAAISAAAQISPLIDWADLDGNVLITNDPYTGATLHEGRLTLSLQYGCGVHPKGKPALITVSTSDMKGGDDYSIENISMALMGTPVRLIEEGESFDYISTPEGYCGWVLHRDYQVLTDEEYEAWKHSERLIVLDELVKIYADAEGKTVIADAVKGCIVQARNQGGEVFNFANQNGLRPILLPNKKEAYIKADAVTDFKTYMETVSRTQESIAETAMQYVGSPYCWGATSPKGFDCSGLCRFAYYMHGIILARDARQQIFTGDHVDFDFSQMQPGDLLYFGSTQRISHVGMYIGDGKMVHSSLLVRVNSVDKTNHEIEYYETDNWLREVRRMVNKVDTDPRIINILSHPWYF